MACSGAGPGRSLPGGSEGQGSGLRVPSHAGQWGWWALLRLRRPSLSGVSTWVVPVPLRLLLLPGWTGPHSGQAYRSPEQQNQGRTEPRGTCGRGGLPGACLGPPLRALPARAPARPWLGPLGLSTPAVPPPVRLFSHSQAGRK